MNEALDELVSDYVYYVLATKPPSLSFAEWCNNPVLCDQELLAQTGIMEAEATIADLRTQVSRDTRERLVPAGEPISPVGTES